jgi:hypothetical protein
VCNCFEHEIGIAEYVWRHAGMTIDIRAMDRRLRQADWTGSYLCGPVHRELFGKTAGIVGFGRIGREVARRAQAFGMRVLACTRTPGSDALAERIDGVEGLHAMLGQSDFVVITAPLHRAHAQSIRRPRVRRYAQQRGAHQCVAWPADWTKPRCTTRSTSDGSAEQCSMCGIATPSRGSRRVRGRVRCLSRSSTTS